MDKVLLRKEDVAMLQAWYREHKQIVHTLPCPLKSVEITFAHHAWRIRGIREEQILVIYVSKDDQRLGKLRFEIGMDNKLRVRAGKMKLSKSSFDVMLTLYCTLMAFMVYEKPELVENNEPPVAERKNHWHKSRPAKKQTTYILRQRTVKTRGAQGGHHASPKGIFTVRGHYRQYKSGKRIWVAEYKKGTGEKKSKTYKIGGNRNEIDSADRA